MNQILRCVTINKKVIEGPIPELVWSHHYQMYHPSDIFQPHSDSFKQQAYGVSWIYLQGYADEIQLFAAHTLWHSMMLNIPKKNLPRITRRGTKAKNKPYFLNLGQKNWGGHAPRQDYRSYFGSNPLFQNLTGVIYVLILHFQTCRNVSLQVRIRISNHNQLDKLSITSLVQLPHQSVAWHDSL